MGLKKTFLLTLSLIVAIITNLTPATIVKAATGAIIVSPTTGQVGTPVTVTGSGFTGTTYFVFFDGISVLSGTITAGAFSTTYSIPTKPRGNYPFRATSNAPDDSNIFYFGVTPALSLSPSLGSVGDTFFISGTGFAPGSVNVYFDSSIVGSPNADGNGLFSITVTVLQTTRGIHYIKASDSGSVYSPQYSYTVNPKIIVTPTTVFAGSAVTVSGTGLTPGPLTFYIDADSFPATGTIDSSGNLQTTLTIPAVSGGSHTLKIQDSSGGSATATISINAVLSINPQNGPAGTTVTVSGKGFGANKSVTLTWKGTPISSNPASISTDNAGSFSATVTVPAGLAGIYTVSASDGTLTAGADFSMQASVSTGVSSSEVGGNITLGGSGFNANMPVTIKYDNVQIATAIADSTGAFSASIVIPASFAGSHTITASDNISTTISVTSSTSLSLTSGYVGSEITVTGSGFSAGKTITVKYDDIQVATTTSDANGGFTGTFKAPASKGGNHTITATDGSYTKISTFAMDSTPPPLPSNLLPENKSNADALAKFTWSPSNDPSGVTYELQVATDAGFGAVVMDKKGLTTPGYQTTEAEKFKTVGGDTPYYWRVKAIDGAGNESEWTKPQSFSVGFIFPTWGIYIIFGFVCILAGAGGFWLGRRTSFRWDW